MNKKNTNDVATAKLKNVLHHAGACSLQPTTVVDLTGPEPVLVRRGGGSTDALGL
jgi:tRNA A37 threonylcarbamoyladenosine synthetase subunit TsaC/SUA5/YrdC